MTNTATTYRYSLSKGSKKVKCPECGHMTGVPYVDNETGETMPFLVSRCDRENKCGYHYTPKHYFADNGKEQTKPFIEKIEIQPVKIDFLPLDYIYHNAHHKYHKQNNFFQFLVSLFGIQVTTDLFKKYVLGTANYWKGAAMFPQIDPDRNLRQVKIMLHDRHTGKRVKEGALVERYDRVNKCYIKEVTDKSCSLVYGKYLNEFTKGLNLEQTFFGAHLLTEYPSNPVCIVESEKTALIASVYMPEFIWLATGGASGCRWREYATYKILKGRAVTFFPDHGYFNKKSEKTCYQEWSERVERINDALGARFMVSSILENRLAEQERTDQDLADLLIIRDKGLGTALTTSGYPVSWDYKTN